MLSLGKKYKKSLARNVAYCAIFIIVLHFIQVAHAMSTMTASMNNTSSNEACSFTFNTKNCKQTFVNKSGQFDTASLFAAAAPVAVQNVNIIPVQTSHFPTRVQCRYEFYAEGDERIQIKFLDFNIPSESRNSTDCKTTDSLQLLTQVRGKYEPIELYCGAFLPKPIMSKGPKLLLQFMGKYPANVLGTKVNYYGFKAEYRFLTNFGITTGQQVDNNCTFIYNSTSRKSGSFASPNFPGYYPQNMICHYLFYGQTDEIVVLHFIYFDVEGLGTCEYLTASDYVEFSNFMSIDRKYSKYCGKRDKFVVRSDGRFFRVSFHSNDRFDKTGFRALFDFENKLTRVAENTSMQSFVSNAHFLVSMDIMKILLMVLILNGFSSSLLFAINY